ncbi:MAG TPA: condensation domain-containing protein [Rugosimonospora sp.]|nr:condensation domain-containing protein [Rugosimonospora sp.]
MSQDGSGLPLSHGQQGIWYLEQLFPGTSAYNVPAAWRISGGLDVLALRRAVRDVVARHAPLRSTFSTVDGEPRRFASAAAPVELSCHDHRRLTPDQHEAAVAAQTAEPFDLAAGPPCHFDLYRLDDEQHLLLATMHHLVTDGWSVGVLVRELAAAYAAPHALAPPPDFDYSAYVDWQRGLFDAPTRAEHAGYWRSRLAGAPSGLALPADGPGPDRPGLDADRLSHDLPDRVLDACADTARRLDASPFVVHLAAFVAVLHRWTGATDIVVGVPVAGRDHPATEPLIGYFVNMVPVRVNCAEAFTFTELVRRVRVAAYDAYRHSKLPFSLLVEELRAPHDAGRSPVFQVTAVPHTPIPGLDLSGLRAVPLELPRRHGPFELSLQVHGVRGDGACHLRYRTNLFAPSTVEDLLRCYQTALEYAGTDPDGPVERVPSPRPATVVTTPGTGTGGADPAGPLPGPGAGPRDVASRVAALVADALGVPKVSVEDDFFELGGHSLRLARLVSRLSQEFDIELDLADIVDDPTVGGIMAGVASALRRPAAHRQG